MNSERMTVTEAAEYLRVSKSMLRMRYYAGKIRTFKKFGNTWTIERSEVEEIEQESKR